MNVRKRFAVAYAIVIAFFLSLGVSALVAATTLYSRPAPAPATTALVPITNKTWPNKIETHFAGKPLHRFSPTLLQMPSDGYCEDFSNKVSWRVFVCMGAQPESQP